MTDSSTHIRQYNTRLGLVLFAVYLTLYAVFVLTNTFAADKMELIVVAGLNLAIVYGFGLIIAAFVMALAYGMMCKAEPTEPNADQGGEA